MTVCGVIASRERAVVWADSQVFVGDEPAGYSPKLAINAAACAVGTGTGRRGVLTGARRELLHAVDFDQVVGCISRTLRVDAVRCVDDMQFREPGSFGRNAYIIAGWSAEARRVLAWQMSADNFFAPALTNRWSSPYVAELDECDSERLDQMLALAGAQMRELRQWLPKATGGTLTVAELVRSQIVVRTFAQADWFHSPETSDAPPEHAESGAADFDRQSDP